MQSWNHGLFIAKQAELDLCVDAMKAAGLTPDFTVALCARIQLVIDLKEQGGI